MGVIPAQRYDEKGTGTVSDDQPSMQPVSLSVAVNEDASLLFSTPILERWIQNHELVNAELAAQIRRERARKAGVTVSNSGGWHSQPTLWEWPGAAVECVRMAVHDAVLRISALSTMEERLTDVDVQYIARGWANLSTNGAYNSIHSHGDAHWSIVYYVVMGEEDDGHEPNGRLVLFDPRSISSTELRPGYGFGNRLVIDPEPGKLIVFPGWLQHWVTPYFGPGERISVAINIEVTGGRHSGAHL